MNITQLLEKYEFVADLKVLRLRIENRKKLYVIKSDSKYFELSDEKCEEIDFVEKPKYVAPPQPKKPVVEKVIEKILPKKKAKKKSSKKKKK